MTGASEFKFIMAFKLSPAPAQVARLDTPAVSGDGLGLPRPAGTLPVRRPGPLLPGERGQ